MGGYAGTYHGRLIHFRGKYESKIKILKKCPISSWISQLFKVKHYSFNTWNANKNNVEYTF